MNEPEPLPDAYMLPLSGRIDANRAPGLDGELEELYEAGQRHILIDMADVTYISSSGLRVLLLAHRRQQQAGGGLMLKSVPPRIMAVLKIAGFDRLFVFCPQSAPGACAP
jgi:anti-sigma B factor antagonist